MAYSRSIAATDASGAFHNLTAEGKRTVAELMAQVLPLDKQEGAALLTPSGFIFSGDDEVQSLLDNISRGEVARISRALPAG